MCGRKKRGARRGACPPQALPETSLNDGAKSARPDQRDQTRLLPGTLLPPSAVVSSSTHLLLFRQIAQYTCQYDAKLKSVQCLPFVRTFLETGRTLSEVTPSVNQGGRLPVAEGFKGLTEPLYVPFAFLLPQKHADIALDQNCYRRPHRKGMTLSKAPSNASRRTKRTAAPSQQATGHPEFFRTYRQATMTSCRFLHVSGRGRSGVLCLHRWRRNDVFFPLRRPRFRSYSS